MNKNFYLFGEIEYAKVAHETLSRIETEIKGIDAMRLPHSQEELETYIVKMSARYSRSPVMLDFNNKKTHPFFKKWNQNADRVFIAYEIPVTGDTQLLNVMPRNSASRGLGIVAIYQNGHIRFEIDADYFNSLDIPEEKFNRVKSLFHAAKDAITKDEIAINEETHQFNSQITDFIRAKLKDKINAADQYQKAKKRFDF